MMRRLFIPLALAVTALVAASCGSDSDTTNSAGTTAAPLATTAPAGGTGNACTTGKTLKDGTFTVATGNPAFEPWVIGDKPETGEGFEAAVAYAVADKMGFAKDKVTWVRTSFDEAIAPGKKNFDVNLQQISINDERKQAVSFSAPYYTTNQAVVGFADSAAANATSVADLKDLKFGAQVGTTSLDFIETVIKPTSKPFVYDDNVGAKAALEAKQIDAIVLDLPTAFYVSSVEIPGTKVIGQFPPDAGGKADQFGMVLDLGNPLVECIDAAIATLSSDGSLQAIEQQWLSDKTGAPVISVG